MSVVRMELLAALLAAKIRTMVASAFEEPPKLRFFSDSQVNLARMLNDSSIYQPFVANILATIKRLTKVEDWF